ncbi:MAG: hypothetical protein A2Z72_04050 [Omnitrophica bacterium RBG_13_46_9]|nr:MAG: hypothetical protein A2Z72_04050 [Omnitrophica bacterium RBG_13_46_9]
MRLGVHVSIAGSIYEALERARSLNCQTMQIFSRNPRGWMAKHISARDAKLFIRKRNVYDIRPLVVHIPYLINLASPDENLFNQSIKAFVQDIRTADLLKAEYFVTHTGSHRGRGRNFGLKRFSEGLNRVLKKAHPQTEILLETTAGSGFGIGDRFEDLRFILNRVKKEGLGICLDTAHVFAAGYDISKKIGLNDMLEKFDRIVGLKRLKVIHLNDSKTRLGSCVDRHEHIGKGKIGLEGFRRIVNNPRLSDIPMILETPKKKDKDDSDNLNVVRKLRR